MIARIELAPPNITVMSLSDQLNFGIVLDSPQVDDPWPLIDRLREAPEDYARTGTEQR